MFGLMTANGIKNRFLCTFDYGDDVHPNFVSMSAITTN